MQHTVYLISDIHLGPGRDAGTGQWNALEDFQNDEALCAFLDHIGASPTPVELVIAGDFIDYPQILPDLAHTSPSNDLGTTQAESVERTLVVLGLRPEIASGHPQVFTHLRRFMENGHSITIIVGNHDIDLLWSEVWRLIFDAIYPPGAPGQLRREAFSYTIGSADFGRVYIEHGHEHDIQNSFGDQMREPFGADRQGVQRLKRCFGTLFVDRVYNQLERERWFIDNVKPISRVVKLGLANDFRFTASALALIARFLLTSGASLHVITGGVLSAEERNAETVVETLEDEALRQELERRLMDPEFRAAFEQAVQMQFEEQVWQAVSQGGGDQPTLDSITQEVTAEPPMLDPDGAVLGGGVLGGEAEDAFRAAARAVLEADPRIEIVVMGHTHQPIDGLIKPIYLSGQRTGYYYNSGTWTWHLRDRPEPYSWQDLADPANYTSSFTYLRFDPDADGAYQCMLRNWSADWDGPNR